MRSCGGGEAQASCKVNRMRRCSLVPFPKILQSLMLLLVSSLLISYVACKVYSSYIIVNYTEIVGINLFITYAKSPLKNDDNMISFISFDK